MWERTLGGLLGHAVGHHGYMILGSSMKGLLKLNSSPYKDILLGLTFHIRTHVTVSTNPVSNI